MDPTELIKIIFGEAASQDFIRIGAIFALCAYVHSKQVRTEIRTQFGELVKVLREDLDTQQTILGKIIGRVDTIESILRKKGDDI